MIFLLFAIFCSVSIGILIHFSEVRKYHRISVMAANYWMASFLGYQLSSPITIRFTYTEWILSVLGGITFVAGFLAIMISIKQKGLAIPVTIMRLSVIYPVVISVLFWGERITFPIAFALILTFTSIGLFTVKENMKKTIIHVREHWIPVFLLITVMGMADTLTRALEYYGSPKKFESYLFILFGTAGLVTSVLLFIQKEKITGPSLLAGLLLGIPNYFTSHFILKALSQLQAVIVFPVFNLGVIVISVLFALILLKEKLTFYEKWGIVVAIPAILLLQLT
jgi:drug/metabolite transporter (DMT)-like permease